MRETSFSIIVPIYNTKIEYIKECFDSLLNLDYKDYEIIVVDDGSNNETKNFLCVYNNNPKIKIYSQDNQGQYASRVNGINHSSGDYILFVDSDDCLRVDSLRIINDKLMQNDYDMLLFECSRFSKNTSNIIYTEHTFDNDDISKDDVLNKLFSFGINGVCLKCVKSSIAKKFNIDVDRNIREGEDIIQSSCYIKPSKKFGYVPNDLYLYRFNENQRDYYGTNNLQNINFISYLHKIFFTGSTEYDCYLPLFKKNSIKSILVYCFDIFLTKNDLRTKKELYKILLSQVAIKTVSETKTRTNIIYEILFKFFVKKKYLLFNFLSKIYKKFI